MSENQYIKLASIDVSKHIEKKQNLSYLSWPFAVDQLMRHDPQANWEFHPPEMYGETMMISCTVTAFGKPVKMHLPVMDHRNQAVKNPDAFIVNKNMMRCLVKAIACHGLGINIYAGEDLPLDEDGNVSKTPPRKAEVKPPAKIEGKEGPWQVKVDFDPDADPKVWVEIVVESIGMSLQAASSRKDVMDIFKVNRNIIDRLKLVNEQEHTSLLSKFKSRKEEFPGEE